MLRHIRQATRVFLVCGLFASAQAIAGGYERSTPFGGKAAPLGGIATPWVQGAEALFFNPAGLVSDRLGHSVNFDVSPTQSEYTGPINNDGINEKSDKGLSFPFGFFHNWTTSEKWGLGFGIYSAGGSKTKYSDVAFTGPTATADLETDLTLLEFAVGAGYRLSENLKVGLAYRITQASGGFTSAARGTGTLTVLEITDLDATEYQGFKLGAQYKLSENTLIGLTWRTEVNINATGKFGGNVYNPGPAIAIAKTDMNAKTTFPQAFALGAQQNITETFKILGEVVWTEYSKVEHVTLDGAIVRASNGATLQADAADLEQKWHDQWNYRLAMEYTGFMMPIRAGYVYTTNVTDDNYARATFTAPGDGQTFTLGSAYNITDSVTLDFGGEYIYLSSKGNPNGAAAGATTGDLRAGQYSTEALGAHLGLTINM